MAFQLQALDKMKPELQTAEASLASLASTVVKQYETDAKWAGTYGCNPNYIFPAVITEQLVNYRDKAQALADNFRLIFSGLSPAVSRQFGVTFEQTKNPPTGNSQADDFQELSREEIGIYYTQSYREEDVFTRIKDVQDTSRLAVLFSCVMTNLGTSGN